VSIYEFQFVESQGGIACYLGDTTNGISLQDCLGADTCKVNFFFPLFICVKIFAYKCFDKGKNDPDTSERC
jgi:hypothetical protein